MPAGIERAAARGAAPLPSQDTQDEVRHRPQLPCPAGRPGCRSALLPRRRRRLQCLYPHDDVRLRHLSGRGGMLLGKEMHQRNLFPRQRLSVSTIVGAKEAASQDVHNLHVCNNFPATRPLCD